jgi:hypothetical protein
MPFRKTPFCFEVLISENHFEANSEKGRAKKHGPLSQQDEEVAKSWQISPRPTAIYREAAATYQTKKATLTQ